jgi:hypothetical protein
MAQKVAWGGNTDLACDAPVVHAFTTSMLSNSMKHLEQNCLLWGGQLQLWNMVYSFLHQQGAESAIVSMEMGTFRFMVCILLNQGDSTKD